jgi:hypothetical protein
VCQSYSIDRQHNFVAKFDEGSTHAVATLDHRVEAPPQRTQAVFTCLSAMWRQGDRANVYTAGMAKKAEQRPRTRKSPKWGDTPVPTTWNIDKIASKAVSLGTVEATDEAAASEKAAVEFQGAS